MPPALVGALCPDAAAILDNEPVTFPRGETCICQSVSDSQAVQVKLPLRELFRPPLGQLKVGTPTNDVGLVEELVKGC